MLTKNQEIIYRKNGSEIGRITRENSEEFPLTLAQYVRDYQPFTSKGNRLSIPENADRIIRTSEVDTVKRDGNTLIVKTLNSVYEIEYKGINLERLLKDGQFKGVNQSKDGVTPALFPEN